MTQYLCPGSEQQPSLPFVQMLVHRVIDRGECGRLPFTRGHGTRPTDLAETAGYLSAIPNDNQMK